jgi:hypothetical protein
VVIADGDNFKSVDDSLGHHRAMLWSRDLLKLAEPAPEMPTFAVASEGVQLTIERIREKFAAETFCFRGPNVTARPSFGVPGRSMPNPRV